MKNNTINKEEIEILRNLGDSKTSIGSKEEIFI